MVYLAGERIRHNQEGTDRLTMGKDSSTSAPTQTLATRRTSAGRQSSVFGGDSLGTPQWRPMEGFTEGFPFFQHLLASAARLGRRRFMAHDLASIPGRTGRRGQARLGRDLCRRLFRLGKKRGACVGKTKRGKGTKWMVVVDGQGVPLGKHLDSASPNEVTLIEKTLSCVAVPRNGPEHRHPRRPLASRWRTTDHGPGNSFGFASAGRPARIAVYTRRFL